jgi:hypothetical protein
VNKDNFLSMLKEKYHTLDPAALLSVASNLPPALACKFFRHSMGDRVLMAKITDHWL